MGRVATFDEPALTRAGIAVARQHGWTAVTMRSVAAELGVTPMALYRLVPDADGLQWAVADAAAPSVTTASTGTGLAGVLRAWAVDAYRSLRRVPGLSAYVIVHWTELPHWLDVVETLLGRAETHGLEGPDAVAAVNAVFAYVLARAQLHDAVQSSPRRRLEPLAREPDRYPRIRRDRAEYATARTDRHFAFGLEALLRGLSSTSGDGRP